MNKQELKDRIKSLVLKTYKSKSKNPIDLDTGKGVSLDSLKFPILGQFPKLKKVIIDLFTSQFEIFISKIEWVAPKPTTFRIVLANDEFFYLIFSERSWIAKVEGKKYYLLNKNEEEQAVESISNLLTYGKAENNTETETKASSSSTEESPSETGGGDGGEEPTPEEEPE